ncbi:hypothetical protein D030_2242B, partial [Vibrio parahaemolyticus AQ3810]
PMAG